VIKSAALALLAMPYLMKKTDTIKRVSVILLGLTTFLIAPGLRYSHLETFFLLSLDSSQYIN